MTGSPHNFSSYPTARPSCGRYHRPDGLQPGQPVLSKQPDCITWHELAGHSPRPKPDSQVSILQRAPRHPPPKSHFNLAKPRMLMKRANPTSYPGSSSEGSDPCSPPLSSPLTPTITALSLHWGAFPVLAARKMSESPPPDKPVPPSPPPHVS